MGNQPNEQEWPGIMRWRPQQPIFGRLSLWVLGAAAVFTSLLTAVAFFGTFGEREMGFAVLGLHLSGILCIANVVIAWIGLVRREAPLRPALMGFILSLLPALGGIYLFCGAPW